MARRRPIFDQRQKVADVWRWSVRRVDESGRRKGELAMRVEYHMQVRSYSCFQDILCKKFMCLCDVSVGKVMCTYEGRMSANFLPEINNCQCLAIVGEIGRRKS